MAEGLSDTSLRIPLELEQPATCMYPRVQCMMHDESAMDVG